MPRPRLLLRYLSCASNWSTCLARAALRWGPEDEGIYDAIARHWRLGVIGVVVLALWKTFEMTQWRR